MHESFFANPRTWVSIAFVLFVVIFGRRLWTALTGLLDGRAAAIRAELDEAARLRTEAEQMMRDAELRRTDAIAEAHRLIEGAKTEAARVSASLIAEAEASAKRREAMALGRIAAAEKAAVDDVRLTAADVATAAARDVLAHHLPPEAGERLIDTAIAGLPGALRAA